MSQELIDPPKLRAGHIKTGQEAPSDADLYGTNPTNSSRETPVHERLYHWKGNFWNL